MVAALNAEQVEQLIRFVTERLDGDQRIAEACQVEVGTVRKGEMYADGSGVADRDDFPSYPWGSGAAELAFIEHNNPARALRDVTSKRRILTEVVARIDELDRQAEHEFGSGRRETTGESDLLLKLLAAPYASHPGWREGWRADVDA